jgi:hypothetical protein
MPFFDQVLQSGSGASTRPITMSPLPVAAELPPAGGGSIFPGGRNYGDFLQGMSGLSKYEGPIHDDLGHGLFTDGGSIYAPTFQMTTQGSGENMADAGFNYSFPTSIARYNPADFYLHEPTGQMRPQIGSSRQRLNPITGAVMDEEQYRGRSTGDTFADFVKATIMAMSLGAGAAALGGSGVFGTGTSMVGEGVAGGAMGGTGLTAGGSGLGMTGTTGAGMGFTGGGGLGVTGASAGAGQIGAGLGMSEFAAGTGSLLGSTALSGGGGGAFTGQGLTAGGSGLGLSPGNSGLGMTGSTTGPGAFAGEVGTGGLAGGTGSLLGPAASGGGTAGTAGGGTFQNLMKSFQSGGFGGVADSLISQFIPAGPAQTFLSSAAKYGPTLMQIYSGMEGRKQSKKLQKQMELPDPGDVTKLPGYQAGLEAVQRSMAAQGYQGSGNMMLALQRHGENAYNQAVNQRLASAQAQAGPVTGRLSSNALMANGIMSLARMMAS